MSPFLSVLVPNALDARLHQYINEGVATKDSFYIKCNIQRKFLGWFCSKNSKMLTLVSSRFFCQFMSFYGE